METIEFFVKGLIATTGGMIVGLMGGLDKLLSTLLVLIVLDYLTGLLKAIYNKKLSSDIGFRGISKKVVTLVVVALAYIVEGLTGEAFPLREITIMFFVANEGISILENAAATGLPIPSKIRELLLQLQKPKEGE